MTIAPDNFSRDWYGYLTNQCGHMVLGLAIVTGWCALAVATIGEFPDKWIMLVAVAGTYLGFEIAQGGRWADSIEDTIFTAGYGAGGALLVFDWTGGFHVVGDLSRLHPWVWLCIAQLTLGCIMRYAKQERADK